MTTQTLQSIALGDASAAAAQKVIGDTLRSNEAGAAGRVYDALRAFVLLMLIERRGADDDLPAWAELFRRTRAALKKTNAVEAEWLRPLSDLVGDAIGFAESYRIEEIVRRAHVREILCTLRDHEDARGVTVVSRDELKRRTKLKDSNLSKVVGTLIHHGLVERHKDRQSRAYELTARGRQLLRRLPRSPSERHLEPDLALGEKQIRMRVRMASRVAGERAIATDSVEAETGRMSLAVTAPVRESFVSQAAPKTKRSARFRKAGSRTRPAKLSKRTRPGVRRITSIAAEAEA